MINLNAIPTAGNKILADEYDLVQLITTSQLLLTNYLFSTTPECTLMGGINYEFDTTQYNSNTINESVMVQEGFTLNDSPEPNQILRGKVWTYLKGSDTEIDQIFPLFKKAGWEAITWKGYVATEEQFKNLSRSRQTEFSTHHSFIYTWIFLSKPLSNYHYCIAWQFIAYH